ncbi:MAG: hypothetical protein YYHSYBAR_002107 [Candidatus Fervidibacter sacchari]|jgi:hypothetical protein
MLSAKTRQDFKTLASQGTNFGNGIVMNDKVKKLWDAMAAL